MAAKQSAEMREAKRLIESGVPVYKACEQAGITHTAVYRAAWYRARKLASKSCNPKRQGDEMFCAGCGKRWGIDEESPEGCEK